MEYNFFSHCITLSLFHSYLYLCYLHLYHLQSVFYKHIKRVFKEIHLEIPLHIISARKQERKKLDKKVK